MYGVYIQGLSVAYTSHYLNQRWFSVNWNLRKKPQCNNFDWIKKFWFQKIHLEMVSAKWRPQKIILSRPHFVSSFSCRYTLLSSACGLSSVRTESLPELTMFCLLFLFSLSPLFNIWANQFSSEIVRISVNHVTHWLGCQPFHDIKWHSD